MSSKPPVHKAVRVLIFGRVQGVGYRAWTAKTATKLALSGWVRNLSSGNVEAVFAGEAGTVDMMIAACRKGPIAAKVTEVEVADWREPVEPGFSRQPTA